MAPNREHKCPLALPNIHELAMMSEMMDLRILLVGNGGREHALAWKLNQSPRVRIIFVAPGNGGTARGLDKVQNVTSVKPDDFPGLVVFAKENDVNFVIPGPEAPLVAGIETHFKHGRIKGPVGMSIR